MVLVWLGIPAGPEQGVIESVGWVDGAAVALGLASFGAALMALRPQRVGVVSHRGPRVGVG